MIEISTNKHVLSLLTLQKKLQIHVNMKIVFSADYDIRNVSNQTSDLMDTDTSDFCYTYICPCSVCWQGAVQASETLKMPSMPFPEAMVEDSLFKPPVLTPTPTKGRLTKKILT